LSGWGAIDRAWFSYAALHKNRADWSICTNFMHRIGTRQPAGTQLWPRRIAKFDEFPHEIKAIGPNSTRTRRLARYLLYKF
jgi:hypothetical protein